MVFVIVMAVAEVMHSMEDGYGGGDMRDSMEEVMHSMGEVCG